MYRIKLQRPAKGPGFLGLFAFLAIPYRLLPQIVHGSRLLILCQVEDALLIAAPSIIPAALIHNPLAQGFG